MVNYSNIYLIYIKNLFQTNTKYINEKLKNDPQGVTSERRKMILTAKMTN